MPPESLSRRPLLSLPSTNALREPECMDQFTTLLPRLSPTATARPLTPLLLHPPSLIRTMETPYLPPLTPPAFVRKTMCDVDDQPFPCTPSTSIFSPTSERSFEDRSDGSYAQPSSPNTCESPKPDSYTLGRITPSSRLHPSHTSRVPTGPVEPIPKRVQPGRRPHLIHYAKSDQTFTTARFNATNADLYSTHFPPGHVLDVTFVREYAPGGEIGAGGFGFVVTAMHRLQRCEVAVKFIERRKVPQWGWCEHSELGHVPKEVMVLKMLDHPGVVKFVDFFQDQKYFYLVQELHGSPWRRRGSEYTDGVHSKGRSAPVPVTVDSVSPVPCTPIFATAQAQKMDNFQQILDIPPEAGSCQIERSEFPFPHFTSPVSESSSATFPSCSASSPGVPHPQVSSRPNVDRRFSHDLFECIEEHKHLSESQARYVFAQVVDVVHYLDSIGVAHRDIKDENVLIDKAFRVKVIDFGSASYVDPNHLGLPRPWYQEFRGTIAYAPAEIFKGVKMHQAEPADVWALGILLSCLICGRRPFATTEDAIEGRFTLYRCKVRVEGGPPSRAQKINTVSEQCWDLLKRCLDPNPATRARISEVRTHPWLVPVVHSDL